MFRKRETLPSWVEPGTEGFVFATTGEKYTVLARRAARTLRQVMPDCNIDLFTDQKIKDDVFDRIHQLGHGWFRPKMQAIRESRFERSVVMDADIVVTADISEVFQILDQCDIAGVEGTSRSRAMLETEYGVPRCFPAINSGFLAVKASDALREFANQWEKSVRRRNLKLDQPAFRDLLYNEKTLKFLNMGTEYNFISLAKLDVWGGNQMAPRVLHVQNLHKQAPGDPTAPITLVEALGKERAAKVEKLLGSDWSLANHKTLETMNTSRAAKKAVKKNDLYSRAVAELASAKGKLRICVIGANDGKTNDPLYRLMESHLSNKSEVILFEPQEYLIPILKEHYGFHPNCHIVNAAVGPQNELDLYAVRPEYWKESQPPYAANWPVYRAATGITSTNRAAVVKWVKKWLPESVDPELAVAKLNVPCAPLIAAFEELALPLSVDVLQVDAEGFDDEVIYSSSIDRLKPKIIYFEIALLPKERRLKLRRFLKANYDLMRIEKDMLAIRR